MTRRRRAPRPPLACYQCGHRLAWLPRGNDAVKPVDPDTRMVLRDARSIPNLSYAAEGEATGYDIHGYLMAGARVDAHEANGCVVACGSLVEVWNYHACDPVERARFQAAKNPEPVEADPRVPE